jgi:hypothetical protein
VLAKLLKLDDLVCQVGLRCKCFGRLVHVSSPVIN